MSVSRCQRYLMIALAAGSAASGRPAKMADATGSGSRRGEHAARSTCGYCSGMTTSLPGSAAAPASGHEAAEPTVARTLQLDRPTDLRGLLGPLARGSGDPTMRVAATAAIRASMTPDGP